MINGAHIIIFSADAEADRAFFRDVLGLAHVDAGEGWLIFALPPGELAVHPAQANDRHELYLICDDIQAFTGEMQVRGIPCSPIEEQSWGLLTRVSLPGGGAVGVYEPRRERPGG